MDRNNYADSLRLAKYIMQMRPVFQKDALFSDETGNYVSPAEPKPGEKVTIRFRTGAHNVDQVFLISGPLHERMHYECTRGAFDFYQIEIDPGSEPFRYYFEVTSGALHCFYNKLGITRDLSDQHSFTICPGFHTPNWAKGAVMYQIMVDRFCNGDPGNDVLDNEYSYIHEGVRRVTDWYRRPAPMDVRDFYGGDLAGVRSKLDYLKDLGVDVIYFNPLFVSPSNHKYDTQDYDYIDPHLGPMPVDSGELLYWMDQDNTHAGRYICRVTRKENLEAANEMFISLVEECHARGIRVILDGVFNHCGSFNKWMDRERIYEHQPGYEKGAYITWESPYRSFFHFTNEHEWPYNAFYEGWWGYETLPKLNYESSPQLEENILRIARKWVSPPFNADGWRLDVAADLGHSQAYNHSFWKKFRAAVKEANPDAIILAEHYGDPSSWLMGDEWDTVMNYDAFMEPVTWFFTGMEKHSDRADDGLYGNAQWMIDAMRRSMSAFTGPSLQVAMNELSNHDHSRFLTRTNRKVGRMDQFGYDAAADGVIPAVMREAVIMQMTWPGAPTIYYGDEAGVVGFTDPDNRRTYPWGREDQQMLTFHKAAIRLHKAWPVFTHGSLVFLHADYQVLAYGRFDADTQAVAAFNNSSDEYMLRCSVWQTGVENGGILRRVFYSDAADFSEEYADYVVREGMLEVNLPPLSAAVFVRV